MSDTRSTAEGYLSATNSSDLRVQADVRTDADLILAAAYASMGDPRRMLALRVWRLQAPGDMAGARQIADELGAAMRKSVVGRRGGFLRGAAPGLMPAVTAADLALTVLKWFSRPTCPSCGGRGHPMMKDAPVMDESMDCPDCDGTGIRPLEKLVREEHAGHARWLAAELSGLSSMIFADMKRLMRNPEA